jgi:hypothetical protein
MKPKKEEKVKKEKEKPEKKEKGKGKKEEEQQSGKDEFWQPPATSSSPSISPDAQAGSSDGTTTQFVTPIATDVKPFYYEQRPLDLTLNASSFQQKIQEYGLSKVDIYLPSDDVSKELRRFKTLPAECSSALERLLSDKSSIIKQRVLIILQYLYMVGEFTK